MNSRTLVGLTLVGLLGLASADHHEHHGSVCAMEADAQVALVGCIQEHLDEATATKLNTVKERLECEQLHCVFQKMCERNQGTLEHSGNEFFTDAEKEGFRNAISACRETVHHA
uniref:Putative his-rich 1 n=1 Tax=Amblyomma americanum TaxID=6943 RepID=A0A0C9S3U5_AMBAM